MDYRTSSTVLGQALNTPIDFAMVHSRCCPSRDPHSHSPICKSRPLNVPSSRPSASYGHSPPPHARSIISGVALYNRVALHDFVRPVHTVTKHN